MGSESYLVQNCSGREPCIGKHLYFQQIREVAVANQTNDFHEALALLSELQPGLIGVHCTYERFLRRFKPLPPFAGNERNLALGAPMALASDRLLLI